jgi:hypothetical protein
VWSPEGELGERDTGRDSGEAIRGQRRRLVPTCQIPLSVLPPNGNTVVLTSLAESVFRRADGRAARRRSLWWPLVTDFGLAAETRGAPVLICWFICTQVVSFPEAKWCVWCAAVTQLSVVSEWGMSVSAHTATPRLLSIC